MQKLNKMRLKTKGTALIITLLIFCASSSFGQTLLLKQLKQLGQTVLYGTTDLIKIQASSQMAKTLDSILRSPSSATFPFDSLSSLSTLTSKDARLKIITWNIPFTSGTFSYDGFITYKFEEMQQVYRLHDTSDHLQNPEKLSLTPQNWYGALYYKLIETGKKGQMTYTLLGWDGNNKLFKRKLIEILEFNKQGQAVFGKAIFGQRDKKRVIFDYAPDAAFKLRYEKQGYKIKRWYKSSYSIIKKEMIVFDRLESIRPGLALPQFLVPTGNIIDAYIFKNNRWNLLKDIDARNPAENPSSQPNKPPSLKLTPNG